MYYPVFNSNKNYQLFLISEILSHTFVGYQYDTEMPVGLKRPHRPGPSFLNSARSARAERAELKIVFDGRK